VAGDGAGEGAVGFFVEAGGKGFYGVGEEVVVIGDGEGQTGFYDGELREHGLEPVTKLQGCVITSLG